MAYIRRKHAWNAFRKGIVRPPYKFRAEYDIKWYSPFSYNSFCLFDDFIGRLHYIAYLVYRVLNNLTSLFNSVTRFHRTTRRFKLRFKKSSVTPKNNFLRKCSTQAQNWILYRYYNIKPRKPRKTRNQRTKSKNKSNRRSDSLPLLPIFFINKRIRIARSYKLKKRYLRRCGTFIHKSSFFLRYKSSTCLFLHTNQVLRMKRKKRYKLWNYSKRHKKKSIRYVLCNIHGKCRNPRYKLSLYNRFCVYLRSILSWCVLAIICGVSFFYYLFSIVSSKYKSKYKRVFSLSFFRWWMIWKPIFLFLNYVAHKKIAFFFRIKRKVIRFITRRMRFFLIFRRSIKHVLQLRIFYSIIYIHNSLCHSVLDSNLNILDLFHKLRNFRVLRKKKIYYKLIFRNKFERALCFNMLPLSYFSFSAKELCSLILFLLSLNVHKKRIRYYELCRLLKGGIQFVYRNKYAYSLTHIVHKDKKYNLELGILDYAYFDLSFFLKLNYDLDLYTFLAFCRLCCNEYTTTLSTALWFYEITYSNFLSKYFISSINSFYENVYINNICYVDVDHSYKFISIGDFVEVRKKSLFVDSFITICNFIFQCHWFVIRQFWFKSLLSLLKPFFYIHIRKNKKLSYFIFPRWNISSSLCHNLIRPIMHYVNSKYTNGDMRFHFQLFLNRLEKTLHFFFFHLFEESHSRWNVCIFFYTCWMYNKSVYRKLCKISVISKASYFLESMQFGIRRNIQILQSMFASFVFRYFAIFNLNSVCRLLTEIIVNNKPRTKYSNHVFNSMWTLNLSPFYIKQQVRNDLSLFLNILGKKVNQSEVLIPSESKSKPVPMFLYKFFKKNASLHRTSFEVDNFENAWRYSNLFIVFFLFFKYGYSIKNSTFNWIIKQQRKLVKVAAPVIDTVRFESESGRRRNRRSHGAFLYSLRFYFYILKKQLLRNSIYKNKKYIVKNYLYNKFVKHKNNNKIANIHKISVFNLHKVDFFDYLDVQNKLPSRIKKQLLIKGIRKPFWLYSNRKPKKVDLNRPWWYSVNIKYHTKYVTKHKMNGRIKKARNTWFRKSIKRYNYWLFRSLKQKRRHWKDTYEQYAIPFTNVHVFAGRRDTFKKTIWRRSFSRYHYARKSLKNYKYGIARRRYIRGFYWRARIKSRMFIHRIRNLPSDVRTIVAHHIGGHYNSLVSPFSFSYNKMLGYRRYVARKLLREIRLFTNRYAYINAYLPRFWVPKASVKTSYEIEIERRNQINLEVEELTTWINNEVAKHKNKSIEVSKVNVRKRKYHTILNKESYVDWLSNLLFSQFLNSKDKKTKQKKQNKTKIKTNKNPRQLYKYNKSKSTLIDNHLKKTRYLFKKACRKYIMYWMLRNFAIHKLLGVQLDSDNYYNKIKDKACKSISVNKHKYSVTFFKSSNLFNRKIKKKKFRKWRSIGVYGSFYKDSKFLSFFMKRLKLSNLKKKVRFFMYTQLYKYFDLYRSYILHFSNPKIFYRLKLQLYKSIIFKYYKKKNKFVLQKPMRILESERLFLFFNVLGNLSVSYRSQLHSIVNKCTGRFFFSDIHNLNNTSLLFSPISNKFSFLFNKTRLNYRSILLHYFTKNILYSPHIFSLYGSNVLIFSMKHIKLHLCVDLYGNAMNQFLLNKKIIDFFPQDFHLNYIKYVK